MYKFYKVLKLKVPKLVIEPKLRDSQSHYMDRDSFILSFERGENDSEHFDLSNLHVPDNTNKKVPGKFKHEFDSAKIEVFIGKMSK